MSDVDKIVDTLADLAVPVDKLVPYGRNPRRGDVRVIAESLEANGQYRPIVVRVGTWEVLAGNHTLAAARMLGWTRVAATFVEATDEQAARILAVDNRASDLATNDERELAALLSVLDATEAGLVGSGFEGDDLDDLMARVVEVEQAQLATVPGAVSAADDSEANTWTTPTLKEYAERYEEQGRRLIVLDYNRADYASVTAGLDRLRAQLGVDSNSEAVAAHLAALFPETTAEAVAEVATS